MVKHPWLRGYLDETSISNLQQKIAEAEKNTSVEIVTMVVRSSTSVGHVLVICSLAIFLLMTETRELLLSDISPLVYLPVELVTAFSFGLVLSKLETIQRWFTLDSDMDRQVEMRAELEFFENGLDKTEAKTGVLIFVSMLERRVVVLAGEGVAQKLSKDTWTHTIANLVADLKRADLSGGFLRAVESVANLVTPIFPAGTTNRNELTNHLIIKE